MFDWPAASQTSPTTTSLRMRTFIAPPAVAITSTRCAWTLPGSASNTTRHPPAESTRVVRA